MSSERLPAIQAQGTSSSAGSSPRGGSIGSSSVGNGSASSATSYSSSINGQSGFKTPSPERTHQSLGREHALNEQQDLAYAQQQNFSFAADYHNSMNSIQPYTDVHQSHMAATQAHAPSTGPPSNLGHYSQYQQPPLLQPGPQSYPSAAGPYAQYPYGNGIGQSGGHAVSSSMSSALVPQALPLPAMSTPGSASLGGSQYNQPHTFDTTGQIAPPGMKPRVTATLWEDEGSLCFQVEAKGVCVARREGNVNEASGFVAVALTSSKITT